MDETKAKNPHAVALGRKGAKVSWQRLTAEQRREKARHANAVRWARVRAAEKAEERQDEAWERTGSQ